MIDDESPKERAGVDPDAATLASGLVTTPSEPPSIDAGPPLVAGRYQILGMLGAGAMGTVYRARDIELDELVALKLLRKELAAVPGMIERFRREVKLARRVTHKNVARTFDIGAHAGDRFLTMELVDGEMLGARLARCRRLSVGEVARIGVDVCAGLAAAHAAGVLHRDLKPENVIVARDGRAVITDFGIARAVAEMERRRTLGGLVGTPAYMAPEQVEGVSELDGRADLYALGAMLFELLTGTPAWQGESVIAVAAARLLRPPPDVRERAPELASEIAELLLTLMARAPAERFASAEQAGEAIARLAEGPFPVRSPLEQTGAADALSPTLNAEPRAHRTRIAVLPLANAGVASDEYLAQALTDELVDLLSLVPELRVRPRADAARFSTDRASDVRDAGRELGVDVVAFGSVRREGDDVHVTTRLVTVEDGFQLSAHRFNVKIEGLLRVADLAASAIARALQTDRAEIERPVAADPKAEELYLRGRYLLHHGWFEASLEGVELLREAHARAPDDARIAGTFALAAARVLTGGADYHAVSKSARELAERTLERAPQQLEARVALGYVHLNDAEGAAAALHLRRALSASPSSVEALDALGRLLVEIGRTTQGIATLHRALAIDPTLALVRQAIARTHALLGEYEAAEDVLGPVPEHPGEVAPYVLMSARVALWRRDARAAEGLLRLVSRVGLSALASGRLRALLEVVRHGSLGSEAREGLEAAFPMSTTISPRRSAFHGQIRAEVKLGASDHAGALIDLRRADANGLLDSLWLERCPLLDPIRAHPELVAIRESTLARVERVKRSLD